jgi:ADP-heptose:LPS heptosyltransferase
MAIDRIQATRLESLAPRRVFVLRALQVGDMLCAAPALRALRAALPGAEITLCGLPWAKTFAARFSRYVDNFLEFPGYPGLPEQRPSGRRVRAFLKRVRAARYDLALQMHGSGSFVNSLLMLSGARQTAGFFVPGEFCPDPKWFLPYPERGSEIERLLRLVEFLGAPARGRDLEFPLVEKDWSDLAALDAAGGLKPGEYACIHPGGRWLSRRWQSEKFAAVADELDRQGLQIVITGTADEQDLAVAVRRAMKATAIDLAGQTTLGAAAALVSQARLVVTNDTGMSHIAAAMRVPSVVVVLGSDPERWAPLDRERHRAVMSAVTCRPCGHFDCPIGFSCAAGLGVEPVMAQCRRLLSTTSPEVHEAVGERIRLPQMTGFPQMTSLPQMTRLTPTATTGC